MKPFPLLLLLLILLSLPVWAQPPVPDTVDGLARQYVGSPGARGLIIGIVRNGKEVIKTYGETEQGNGQLPGPDDVFEIGELSGVLTTTLLARMHRDGL
jgi:CubicO group peptidase (beta-lactamase class C family)